MEQSYEPGIEPREMFGILTKGCPVARCFVSVLLYHRLWKILTGEDTNPAFPKIAAATKEAILEILIETKSYVHIYWKL